MKKTQPGAGKLALLALTALAVPVALSLLGSWLQERAAADALWEQEEAKPEKAATPAAEQTVYWTPGGKSYHTSRSCPSLTHSPKVLSGTLEEARAAGKIDPCDNCVEQ